jgi:ssRNA-specific RNase YbeY (16S rRNA maturation enzyme)
MLSYFFPENFTHCGRRGGPTQIPGISTGGRSIGRRVETEMHLSVSRKCENHAKMSRFARNFTKLCFAKTKIADLRENFRKNNAKTDILSQKVSKTNKSAYKNVYMRLHFNLNVSVYVILQNIW